MTPDDPYEQYKPFAFTFPERDLILGLLTLDPELAKRFKLTAVKEGSIHVQLNAYDAEELLGGLAEDSNHAMDPQRLKLRTDLFIRLRAQLDQLFPIEPGATDQKEIGFVVEGVNHGPVDDFAGISPVEMHSLLYDPYGRESILRLNEAIGDEVLDGMPFFRLTETLLQIAAREEKVKLTKGGALTLKAVKELYSLGLYPEDMIERGYFALRREIDSEIIPSVRVVAELAGLLRRLKGSLVLTKEGRRLLGKGRRSELFGRILITFTQKFNWGWNDRITEEPAGQLGWGFSVYLLSRFGGDVRPAAFYSEAYKKAFPPVMKMFREDRYFPPAKAFDACYRIRVLVRFLVWFGLIEYDHDRESNSSMDSPVRDTGRLEKIIRFTKQW
jgi:hypothetical protein